MGSPMLRLLDTKTPAPPGDVETLLEQLGGHGGGPRIRCPHCGWRPQRSDRWGCRCGHSWNTFETAGRCPQCTYQWTVTQCLSCHRYAPHLAWYEPPSSSEP